MTSYIYLHQHYFHPCIDVIFILVIIFTYHCITLHLMLLIHDTDAAPGMQYSHMSTLKPHHVKCPSVNSPQELEKIPMLKNSSTYSKQHNLPSFSGIKFQCLMVSRLWLGMRCVISALWCDEAVPRGMWQGCAWKGSVKYFSGSEFMSGLTTHALFRVLYIVEAFIILLQRSFCSLPVIPSWGCSNWLYL